MRLTRRTYVAVAGGGLTTSLAGCSSLPLIGDDGPTATVEAFLSAVEDDDREAADDLIHPDGEIEELSDADWSFYQETYVDGTVQDTDEDGDQATVTVEMEYDDDEEEMIVDEEWELRTHDDEWKIWDVDWE